MSEAWKQNATTAQSSLNCKIMPDYKCWCMGFVLWVSRICFAIYYNFNRVLSYRTRPDCSTKQRNRQYNGGKMFFFISIFYSLSLSSSQSKVMHMFEHTCLKHTHSHLLHSYIMMSLLSAQDQPYTRPAAADLTDGITGKDPAHWHTQLIQMLQV